MSIGIYVQYFVVKKHKPLLHGFIIGQKQHIFTNRNQGCGSVVINYESGSNISETIYNLDPDPAFPKQFLNYMCNVIFCIIFSSILMFGT